MELSPDQQSAFEAVMEWLKSDEQVFRLGGLAGTGKSTLASHILDAITLDYAVCAYTGKAVNVLQRKGIGEAQTIHSLIYMPSSYCRECNMPVDDEDPVVLRYCDTAFARRDALTVELVVVDEASMVSENILADLMCYDAKILLIGDHGQLPPIHGHSVMQDPDVRLEQIHRQASGSPITRFAHAVRSGATPAAWVGLEREEIAIRAGNPVDIERYDVVICGFNRTRVKLNSAARRARGFSGELPQVGETVICLSNNKDFGVFNGQRFTVTDTREEEHFEIEIIDEAGKRKGFVPVVESQFGRATKMEHRTRKTALFDFGYALSCHKSQGSEYESVAVVEETHPSWNAACWRYTAASRAKTRLHYYV